MNAVLTAEFIANIPEPIRRRLHLEPGAIVDFDESAPFLKATPVPTEASAADTEFAAWLAASAGLARGKFTTDSLLRETRGED